MDRLKKFSEMMDAFYEGSRIIHNYDKKPRKYGTDVDLYMAEMHTLDIIFNNEEITVTELANITHKTKSAITQLTSKLERKGMIFKVRNKDYHKEINLFLTDVGRKTCHYHKALDEANYTAALKNVVEDYSIEDFQKAAEIFTIVTQSMKKE